MFMLQYRDHNVMIIISLATTGIFFVYMPCIYRLFMHADSFGYLQCLYVKISDICRVYF